MKRPSMESFGRKSQQIELKQDKGKLYLTKKGFGKKKQRDLTESILLKVLLVPHLPQDIGEIRGRNAEENMVARVEVTF